MTGYKILKIVTVIFLIAGMLLEVPLFFYSYTDALDNRSLQGAGREQAEYFLIPMMVVGIPVAAIAMLTAVVNGIMDGHTKDIPRLTPLLYAGLVLLILIPTAGSWILLEIMHAGWK